uniref:Bulb-type lectin domain-containing protein n=1 Tax=Cannabis sativa TaxID=3483 RepID=A0A803PX23_CANSA
MAQTSNGNGTIKIGAPLTAGDKVFSWLSPSGEFAFGFHQLPDNKDLFLLAIWFNKLPEKTVVWYADTPNSPIPKGSKLELTADRGLLLTDPQNQELWKSGTIVSQANMAIFNDTVLEKGVVVSSRISSTNFSKGRFQLSLKTDGNVGLYTMNLPSEHLNSNYYTKETTNTGKQLVFNESGSLYILRENNEMDMFSTESASIANYYYRATLDFDGVFTKYSYPKNPTKDSNWSVVWSIPDNICLQRFAYGNSGVCGYNRVCRLDQNKRPLCECIRGFSLVDSNDEYRGCKPSFLQSCVEDSKSSAESRYTIEEMKDVDWPSGDYEILQPYDKENCKEACLSDCTCAIAIYRKNACWKKRLPLNNGKFDTTAEAIAFIKAQSS